MEITLNGQLLITAGGVLYPLTNRCCAQVTACAIRTRTRYSTCVSTNATGGSFKLLGKPCCSPNNAASYEGRPSTLRALWGLAHTKNPAKAKPFVAPYGTSGVYMKDECILWTDGKVYISTTDNNIYNPDEYGVNWREYTNS